ITEDFDGPDTSHDIVLKSQGDDDDIFYVSAKRDADTDERTLSYGCGKRLQPWLGHLLVDWICIYLERNMTRMRCETAHGSELGFLAILHRELKRWNQNDQTGTIWLDKWTDDIRSTAKNDYTFNALFGSTPYHFRQRRKGEPAFFEYIRQTKTPEAQFT